MLRWCVMMSFVAVCACVSPVKSQESSVHWKARTLPSARCTLDPGNPVEPSGRRSEPEPNLNSTGIAFLPVHLDDDHEIDVVELRGAPHTLGGIWVHEDVTATCDESRCPASRLDEGHFIAGALGDLDGDGCLDLVAATVASCDGGVCKPSEVRAYALARGGHPAECEGPSRRLGAWVFPELASPDDWPDRVTDIALGDIDGNGQLDIAMTIARGEAYTDPRPQRVLLNPEFADGHMNATALVSTHELSGAGAIEMFDVDADGLVEVLVVGMGMSDDTGNIRSDKWGMVIDYVGGDQFADYPLVAEEDLTLRCHVDDLEVVTDVDDAGRASGHTIMTASTNHGSARCGDPYLKQYRISIEALDDVRVAKAERLWSLGERCAGDIAQLEVMRVSDHASPLIVFGRLGQKTSARGKQRTPHTLFAITKSDQGDTVEVLATHDFHSLGMKLVAAAAGSIWSYRADQPIEGNVVPIPEPLHRVPRVFCPNGELVETRYVIESEHIVLVGKCATEGELSIEMQSGSGLATLTFEGGKLSDGSMDPGTGGLVIHQLAAPAVPLPP